MAIVENLIIKYKFMYKISLITACFNNEKTIAETLKSVTGQTYANIEHIIIDGASTDGTVAIIQSQISNLKSPAYRTGRQISIQFISEPDKGIYDALNKGINLATGDVIGFLHADDLFFSNQIAALIVDAFEQNNVEAVYGNLQYVSKENTNNVVRNWVSSEFTPAKLKQGWMPAHPTLYLKKEVYSNFGLFNLKYHIAADYDFMLRILSGGVSTFYIPQYIVKMRVGGKSNSIKNLMNKMKEDLNALKKNKVGGIYSLLLKNVSKLPQFINRT
jgi:glycosyltransferase